MKCMTQQEIFDTIVTGLARQGEPAYSADQYRCFYRLKKGDRVLKCAAGMLIPDSRYSNDYEDMSLEDVLDAFFPRLAEHLGFITAMQGAHDRAAQHDLPMKVMGVAFQALGTSYGLDMDTFYDCEVYFG
jgi:hypothetical protein